MPLYMDLHHIDPDITLEDLNNAHLKDIEVEKKYGLEHKKYYVNFEEKTVFCLMYGPNKEAIHDSHAEVHGVGPCNVIEVSSLTPTFDFNAMIGEGGGKNEWDVALTHTGEIDTGFRSLLLIYMRNLYGEEKELSQALFQIIRKHDGTVVMQPDRKIMASFLHAQDAFLCQKSVASYMKVHNTTEYNLALVTGKPVDETGSVLFENASAQLRALCLLGGNRSVFVDTKTKSLFEKGLDNVSESNNTQEKEMSAKDLKFFMELHTIIKEYLKSSSLKSDYIGKALGFSKAQTYRKIKSLTGMAPNELIREVRLRQALDELKNKDKTIAEVAYSSGFNSPTYFTRVFKERFGLLPTGFQKQTR
ncbi:nickel-binding protein [Pareuzebyella sediminis]|uniref:nickel-binding protein n=1 Tax=Pareuzebyella sediminis TaxID=2607998 RepID=UPI0018E0E5B5|nr:nickel-binding protein [Pareuzebyella sediminis]